MSRIKDLASGYKTLTENQVTHIIQVRDITVIRRPPNRHPVNLYGPPNEPREIYTDVSQSKKCAKKRFAHARKPKKRFAHARKPI